MGPGFGALEAILGGQARAQVTAQGQAWVFEKHAEQVGPRPELLGHLVHVLDPEGLEEKPQ